MYPAEGAIDAQGDYVHIPDANGFQPDAVIPGDGDVDMDDEQKPVHGGGQGGSGSADPPPGLPAAPGLHDKWSRGAAASAPGSAADDQVVQ